MYTEDITCKSTEPVRNVCVKGRNWLNEIQSFIFERCAFIYLSLNDSERVCICPSLLLSEHVFIDL